MLRKVYLTLLLLALLPPLSAQRDEARDLASLSLSGPVLKIRESVYLSHSFHVDGMQFKDAEKSVMTGFSEYRFNDAGYMTYYRIYRQSPYREQTDSFTFDNQNRLTGHIWGVGSRRMGRSEHRYNLIGQLVSLRQYDDTDALFCETAYRYRSGLLSEERTFSRANVPISEIHYTYDSLKRLVKEECPWNPYRYAVPYTKDYTYDNAGNINSIRYSEKEVKNRWTYRKTTDAAGRILMESTYDSSDSLLKIRHFHYNMRGRLVREDSQDGVLLQEIRYSYRHGRLHTMRNRYGDTDFRTFFLRYDEWGNWVEKAEYDGINLQVTTREITYGDQPLNMKKTAPSKQSPAQR